MRATCCYTYLSHSNEQRICVGESWHASLPTHTHTYTGIHVYAHSLSHTHKHKRARTRANTHTHKRTRTHARLYTRKYTYTHVHIHTHTRTYINFTCDIWEMTHSNTRHNTWICQTCLNHVWHMMHSYEQRSSFTYGSQAYMILHLRMYICWDMNVCACINIYVYTYIRMYMYIYIYT